MTTKITHVAAVAIIYRETDPAHLFMEVKDDGYPKEFGRRKLNFIGGNWIGEPAVADTSPRETLVREIDEELTLERGDRYTVELELLGLARSEVFKPTPISGEAIVGADRGELEVVKHGIFENLTDYGSFLHFSHPEMGGGVALVSYLSSGLDETYWGMLTELQAKFGNLSNEAPTVILTADEVLDRRLGVAFVHQPALQGFLLGHGVHRAYDLPVMVGIHSVPVGPTPDSYEWVLEHYDIAKKPV